MSRSFMGIGKLIYMTVSEYNSSQNEATDNAIGARLRELRKERGLAAKEVARRAEVSPAYLSRLENGKISPTVATLSRIVQAMGESVARVFGETGTGPVVRKKDRLPVHHRGVADYLVTPTRSGRLEVLETIVEPGAGSGKEDYSHPGDEECILVLDGQLRVWLEGVPYDLLTGDAITFSCRMPHRWMNLGDSVARILWIITPAGY